MNVTMMLREMQLSMMFPGFKFSPTDEELISYYLKKKIEGSDNCVQVIQEVDLCQFEPWELPEKSVIQSSSEWFFFSARGRKYPNGLQSKRATECGYWKATGKERNVKSDSNVIGTKRTLVFHKGRAPKGERTEWIMHEYCMAGNSQDSLVVCRLRKNSEFRLSENPRRGSQNQSGENNSCENEKAVDGCCSSHTSHSVDSETESNQNITDRRMPQSDGHYQIPQSDVHYQIPQSDGHIQRIPQNDGHVDHKEEDGEDGEAEEDCFAAILNDDIIKLDESSLPDHDSNVEGADIKRREITPKPGLDSVPTQGAAHRRIRLHVMETESYQVDSLQESHVWKDDVIIMPHVQTRKRVVLVIILAAVFGLIALFFAFYLV